ncbi:hypothetical protein [Nocardioides bruguierae]|uniref:DUF4406 domain-containing protein n=1 Tax=Nocardioides bruguierae TaxID=2945102 RepID=A0A9X2D691_9ACTN|nr:hypothetical protein [Nocardioides bruguierae]MCM0620025.1 hypothetical protein [Nocardioides bruguierae]
MSGSAPQPVVTLCGSWRFAAEMERLTAELTLAGHVVLAPVAVPREPTPDERERLADVHLRRVAMADEVLVVDVGGYLGESTRREVEHARACGVPVRFLSDQAPA